MAAAPALAATLTLKFADAEALADALRNFSGGQGSGGLCIQVTKYYELGDRVLLHIDYGQAPLGIHGIVAWRKPGFIGVRLEPHSAVEAKVFAFCRQLIGEVGKAASVEPPVVAQTKPFAE